MAETIEGQIIGYGASFRAPWADPGHLASIFCVHPDFREQGVGSMILSHIQGWANENQASVLSSIVMDWIDAALPFVQKRGFSVDTHVFDLELDLKQFDRTKYTHTFEKAKQSGIQFVTLANLPGEESERRLYDLFVETQKDNPGQYSNLPPFAQWREDSFPEKASRNDWVFLAVVGERFIGVTQLFTTDEAGVLYNNYTGVQKEYRGRGIAKALKRLSIDAALDAGANKMTTDSEESNAPMQHINRSFGYIPGQGHYRILKQLKT